MATLTLRKMRRYTTLGITFERGVAVPVPPHIALEVEEDPVKSERFKVHLSRDERLALSERTVPELLEDKGDANSRGPEPLPVENDVEHQLTDGEKHTAVQRAIDELDPDVETNWTQSGKPDARALTKVLGWQVTSEMRDAAMGPHPKQENPGLGKVDDPANGSGLHPHGRIRITRGAATGAKQEQGERAAAQAGAGEGHEQGEGGSGESETGTEDAVEV